MENKLMNEEEFIKAVKKGVEQRIREYADGDEMYCNFEVMDGSSGVIDTDDVVKNTNGWIDCYFDFDYEVEDSRDEKTGVIDFDKMLEDVIDGYCSNMGQSGA
ncbi:MAG: hypothetical protein RR338_06705, partial [Clostridia bacterium]